MNLSAITSKIPNGISSKLGRTSLLTQKHSPAILFGAGVIGVVATVVLASRATLKLDEVLEEHAKKTHLAQIVRDMEGDNKYTGDDYAKDILTLRSKTAIQIAKLYLPAIAVGLVSITALSGSHIILSRRNFAMTAAYKAVEEGFKEYRKRVIEEFGEEKDRDFQYGFETKEVTEQKAEGLVTTEVKMRRDKLSMYAREFSKDTSRNWSPDPGYNQMRINMWQNYANDKLRSKGHLFLNEVYDMIGLERSKAGQAMGWLVDHGDGFVDFGVFVGDDYMGQEFVLGNEKSVILDFNVTNVYDKI